MQKIFFLSIFSFLILFVSFEHVEGQMMKCPQRTIADYKFINFVGKTELGGDKEVKVWFEYGTSEKKLNYKTRVLILNQGGLFCIKESKNIKPCMTYYYRAGAQNSAGTNYGDIKSIKTLCSNNKIKIKNKSDGRGWIIF